MKKLNENAENMKKKGCLKNDQSESKNSLSIFISKLVSQRIQNSVANVQLFFHTPKKKQLGGVRKN